MSPVTSLQPDAVRLLAEAAEWRLLGLLFEYPSAAWRINLESLLPALPRPELRAIAEAALRQCSEGLHIALFGPSGSVPVREVAYQGGVQLGYLMAELSAYYEAFGYEPKVDEAVDHLAMQLGFISFLKMKQALAVADGDTDRAALTAEAAQTFLREHLAAQAEPVLQKLQNFAPEFLIDAGRIVLQYVGPSPRSDYPLSAGVIDDDGSEEMSCGPAPSNEDLIQLQP